MSKKRLNLHEQGYKAGDPMWVSWDKRWDGPMRRELMWEGVYQEERLVTTIGFFRYDDREFLALDRTKRPNGCEDIIYIPTPLVKEYGKFHAEQYSTFIRYIFVYNTLVSERLNVRIRRYAEATNYAKVLTGVYNGIPKGENGMIIKYQEPAQPIKYMGGYDKRGNIVLPVTNENGMNNVTLPEVTVTPRNINLAGAVDRGRRTVGNMGKEILSATTPLGDIESAKDIYQDARSGNYGQAALGAGLLLLPNFIEKPLKALKRVGKKVVKASNKYPAKNLEVNLNPDRSWNMDKIHSDVDKGTKEAIDFLESDVKKETELYNKELAKRLGYEHFTPYPNGADRARVKVTPDYETITYPNGEFAGRVAFDADPSKDILQYNKHYNLHPTAYHETLHRGYYGMADKDRMPMGGNLFEHVKRKTNTRDFYNFKTKKLLVPENEAPDLETYNYLLIEGETAANTMELGKRLGLQPGQEYPGRQALEQMLKEFSESGNEHAFITKYLNMKHPKRVWNALTGKYFVYPLIGTTLIGGMNYDRNE